MYLRISILTLFCLFLSACSEEPLPFDIKLDGASKYDSNLGASYQSSTLYITSKVDELTVENVVANRGNCPMFVGTQASLPKTIKFGTRLKLRFRAGCVISEANVITDDGEWTFTFEE